MNLPNDVARCADALDKNCQWRDNCARWKYRISPRGFEVPANRIVWKNFAADQVGNEEGVCLYQLRID